MIDNLSLQFKRKLISPEELKTQIPISKEIQNIKKSRDYEISEIIKGNSNKLILLIGPCSADSIDSILDYTHRLIKIQEKVKDKIIIIPRVYTVKPRTNCTSYKGMLHQPNPHKAPDIVEGLKAMRLIHKKVIEETGFCCADEILYPEIYPYISDILSYATIGARSIENQEHRFIASGMNIPVGMKNPINGNISTVLQAIKAAQSKNIFAYRGFEVYSKGNELAHIILRGRIDENGKNHPNYHFEDLDFLYKLYYNKEYKNSAVIIDANHSNSGKKYNEQMRIVNEVIYTIKTNYYLKKMIKGFMIESYIEEGKQEIEDKTYGKSITDPCIGFKETEQLIFKIANQI